MAAVPVIVTVGSESVTVSSAASIATGQCEYSYLPYSQLGMQAGQTYSVNVSVGNDQTVYSITVPEQSAAGATTTATTTGDAGNLTANASANLLNPFLNAWHWFVGLFKGL